jgi:hypothetical protein
MSPRTAPGAGAARRRAARAPETGVLFTAYSGPTGPSYGAAVTKRKLLPSVRALEELLAATRPVDCALEVPREIEYGGGSVRIGVNKGKPFEEEKRARRAGRGPTSVGSYEDCVAMAKKRGGRYGIAFGWQQCIEAVLPEFDEIEHKGRTYENCIGFGFSDRGVPVFGFDEGDGPEEIPVSLIRWPTPLSAAATMWLDSYARWKRTAR